MREKVAGERREMTRGGESNEISWRTESCLCCGCVGLWHDDLGQKIKITLPGITTLLWRLLLLLLELEEDTYIPVCFFFDTRRVSYFPLLALCFTQRERIFFKLPVCRSP